MRKVVGIHSCLETLKVRPKKITSLILKKDYSSNPKLVEIFEQAKRNKISSKLVSPQELDKLCEGHQGVALEVSEDPSLDWEQLKKQDKALILALDGLEDPQNLGNIMRSAWLLGVDGVLITEKRSVSLTPSVCKIASGGTEHVPVESFNQLIQPLKDLKELGFWIYGLSEKAEKTLWQEKEFAPKTVLVAGSEMKGMKVQTHKECDILLKIPQKEAQASLNVATSIAISVAEWTRQMKF